MNDPAELDTCTAEFLELVDCERLEVLDTAEVEHYLVPIKQASSSFVIHFGKYRGSVIGDVPESYLLWAVTVDSPNGGFRSFQHAARIELCLRNNRTETSRIEDSPAGIRDACCRCFRRIEGERVKGMCLACAADEILARPEPWRRRKKGKKRRKYKRKRG